MGSFQFSRHAAMEILCPLVVAVCLSLTSALSHQLQSDNFGHGSVRRSRSFESILKPSLTAGNNTEDFSNARFKERKSRKRYSSPSFIPRDRLEHRRSELISNTHFKNVQNESSENNVIDNSQVLPNQRRGSLKTDAVAMPRDRIDHRRIEVAAPAIYKKIEQNQSNENHSIVKSEALSNQRRNSHNSDGLQAMPIAKKLKDYVRNFIVSHHDILQTRMYDKPSYMAVNVHKVQVTTAPLSVNVRSKFPTKMITEQKLQAALGADKQMQAEKHAADSNRKRDGRAPGADEKDLTFREYAKRETGIDRVFKDPPNHAYSDSLKRYISFRDKGIVEPSVKVPGAIGIRTDNIDENIPVENPYAIFYKMHQNLDDGFIPAPGGSVEDDFYVINTKNKQITANYETKNPNRVMKKFFNLNKDKHF